MNQNKVEDLFQASLEKLAEGVQIIAFDWRYKYVNDSLVRQSHYSREQLIGHTMMEMYPGIERTRLFGVLKRCMEQRQHEYLENEFNYPDGRQGWFQLSIQPVPEGLFILSVDVTSQKLRQQEILTINKELQEKISRHSASPDVNAQRALERDEMFQKAFHSNSACMTITRRTDSRFVDVNESFEKLFGFNKREVVGKTSLELGLVMDIRQRDEALKKLGEYGSAKDFEVHVRTRFGDERLILGAIETITINGEQHFLGIYYDITDRKRAELKLKEANEELRTLNEKLSTANEKLEAANDQLLFVNEKLAAANHKIKEQGVKSLQQRDDQFNRVLASTNVVVWSFETKRESHYVSDSVATVYGVSTQDIKNDRMFWTTAAVNEDVAVVKSALEELSRRDHVSFTYRIRSPRAMRLRLEIRNFRDDLGAVIRVEGIATPADPAP